MCKMKVQAAEEQMAGKGAGTSAASNVVSADNTLAPLERQITMGLRNDRIAGFSLHAKGLKSRHSSVQMAECPTEVGNPACNLMGWEM